MNVKERLIRIRETVVSAEPPENTNGILWIRYVEGNDNPFSFYLHDGIEWNPVAVTAEGGAELSQSQIEAIRKASRLVVDGDGLSYLSDDGTYKPLPGVSVEVPTRLSQLINDCGFITGESIPTKTSQLDNDSGYLTGDGLKTINGESIVGDGDIVIEGGSGSSITVDTSLSDSSANPVQNKVVTQRLNEIEDNTKHPVVKVSVSDSAGTVTSHTWNEIRRFIRNEIPIRVLFDSLDIATPIEVRYQDAEDGYYSGVISTAGFRREFRIDNSLSVDITDTYYPETFIFETEAGTTGDDESVTYKVITDIDTIKSCIAAAKARKGNQRIVVNTPDGRYCEFLLVYPRTDSLRASISFGDTGYALSLSSVEDESTLIVKDGVIDLSNYYTKEEVDSKVASGGTFDPTVYYRKAEVDALVEAKQDKGDYALKSDIPDVTDLARKTDIPDVTGLATKSEVSLVEEQTAANAAGILEKVDKVEGKQLSTNDYTDSDKAKVASAITEHQDISGKQDVISDLETIRSGAAKGATALQSFTESDPVYTKDKPTLALKSEIPDVSGFAKKTDIPDTSGLVRSSDLSEVATSGDYNDLTNKPTIPSAVTEQTVSGWGFTKNSGNYSKPTGGIPKSDLASAVQTSLGKADTALQSETDPTVPSWAKQSTKPTYTAAEVGALPSTTKIPSKTSDLSNDSGFLTAHQQLKTVNGNSLVGEGDITVEGGGIYDATSIYNKITSVESGSVEITQDEFEGLLEAANAGKVIQITHGIYTDKSARNIVAESDGATYIMIYFYDDQYISQLNAAKTKAGKYLIALYDTNLLTDKVTDLSGAYYDLWGSTIGKKLLGMSTKGATMISFPVNANDWYMLKNAVLSRKIMDGITYMSYDNSGTYAYVSLEGIKYKDDNQTERFEADVAYAEEYERVWISFRNTSRYLADYEIVETDAAESVNISLDRYWHRVCHIIKGNLVEGETLTVTLDGSLTSNSYGGHDQPNVFEWMIMFRVDSSVPTVKWPSSLRWAGGEVVTLEVGYFYEFHIIATSVGVFITGQKFLSVISSSEM